MDYLIVVKWNTNYDDASEAPGVIPTMISIMTGSKVEGLPIITN
jgi:hypothetical protein